VYVTRLIRLLAGVTLRTYNVIYDLVDDVRAAMEGRLNTVEERTEIGEAEVWHRWHCQVVY
jgi:translation initiation factor IF-2